MPRQQVDELYVVRQGGVTCVGDALWLGNALLPGRTEDAAVASHVMVVAWNWPYIQY